MLKLQELIAKFVVIPILGREFGEGEESLAATLSTRTNVMISKTPETCWEALWRTGCLHGPIIFFYILSFTSWCPKIIFSTFFCPNPWFQRLKWNTWHILQFSESVGIFTCWELITHQKSILNGHFNPATPCQVPKKNALGRIRVIPSVVSPALFMTRTCAFNLS